MKAEYYKLLKEYINFKSISTNKNFGSNLEDCAKRLLELFNNNNFKTETFGEKGSKIIIAQYSQNPDLETCLIYGHYDVQFADQKDGWKEDPFTLYISKDKAIGRGVVDNKGQTLIHIISIFELIKKNKLGYNIIFLLEGEEETGSENLINFININHKNLKSDFILISDGNIIKNYPTIETGFRGGFNVKLEIISANTDLHTGLYGGVVPNPIEETNKLLAKLYDTNNQITIPYFYYEVEELDINQKTINKKITFDEEELKSNFDLKGTKLKDIDFYSKTGRKPCIEITGISGGHTDFFKNSIPNKAIANINFRLVNNQKCESIISLFKERIKNNLPKYLDYKLSFEPCCKAIKLDINNSFIKKAEKILQEVYKNNVLYIKSGGSLPIINHFQENITKNILSIPLANEDSNMHGINENFNTDLIEKGLDFSYKFFQK